VAGACDCDNEILGFIKCEESIDKLRIDYLLKKDFVPWSNEVSE